MSLTVALGPESPSCAVETERGRGDADTVSTCCRAGQRVWPGLTHVEDAEEQTGWTRDSETARAVRPAALPTSVHGVALGLFGSAQNPPQGMGEGSRVRGTVHSPGGLLGSWGQQGALSGGWGPRSSRVSRAYCVRPLNTVTFTNTLCVPFSTFSIWNLEFFL